MELSDQPFLGSSAGIVFEPAPEGIQPSPTASRAAVPSLARMEVWHTGTIQKSDRKLIQVEVPHQRFGKNHAAVLLLLLFLAVL